MRIKKIILILVCIVFSFVALRTYFKFVYFPKHPTSYSGYIQIDDYNPNLKRKFEILEPPAGGCIDICFGEETVVSCKSYSRMYDRCELSCYGYLYNNCSSSNLGMIFGFLTRYGFTDSVFLKSIFYFNEVIC